MTVGHSVIKFECLDIECNKGIAPYGFNFDYGIRDANNSLVGSVEYLMVNGIGVDSKPTGIHNNFWRVEGAEHVNITTLNPTE